MAQTVVGLFENEADARQAAERLEAAGISRSNVDVSRSDKYTQGVAQEKDDDNAVTRFFKNLFGDNDDADRYSRVSKSGSYSIVTVHAQSGDEAERAADLLDDCGAMNVDEKSEQYNREGVSGSRQDFDSSSRTDRDRDSDATISRVKEELQVGKQEVASGGVRVRSRIVEQPVEETLRLREEHVRVERNDVNRPLGDSDRNAFQEQDIELTEKAEVPVVNKEARVVEEIKISKDVEERTETVRDTVRNTEVDIDNIESNERQDDLRRKDDNRRSL